jgi:hypothetical protein
MSLFKRNMKRKIIRAYSPIPIPPVVQGCTVVIQRLVDPSQSLAQVTLRIAQILSEVFSTSPLCYTDVSPRKIEMTEDGILGLLAEIDAFNRTKEIQPLTFGLRESHGKTKLVFYSREIQYRPSYSSGETISFSRPKGSSLEMLLAAFQEICPEIGAFYGYTTNHTLSQLHNRQVRAYEKAVASIPPGETRFYIEPESYPGVTDILPELLLSSEFDYSRVPDGIWWINYWSSAQVEAVGRDRILSAGWFQTIELSNGGMILVATEEQTDVTNTEHMETLKRITEAIDLRGVQEQYRITAID